MNYVFIKLDLHQPVVQQATPTILPCNPMIYTGKLHATPDLLRPTICTQLQRSMQGIVAGLMLNRLVRQGGVRRENMRI